MGARVEEVTFYRVVCDDCKTPEYTFERQSDAEQNADVHDEVRHPTVEPEDG
jgi:hypothetical protein